MNRRNLPPHTDNQDESGEQHRNQEKDSDNKKARFGGLLKENPMKGFNSDAIKRPLTGLFRRTGKVPKRKEDEQQELKLSEPPTSSTNIAKISATFESVQNEEDTEPSFRERNPENGSKLTLADNLKPGSTIINPLAHYCNVGGVDISALSRAFQKGIVQDDNVPWSAQSLFSFLESRVKKERDEAKYHTTTEPISKTREIKIRD